jgi:hypothetical protein
MLNFDFIFFHIPKCGGSSIREYFKRIFLNLKYRDHTIYISIEGKKIHNLTDENKLNLMLPKLKKTKILLSHINCNLYEKLNSKFRITCIRNPIDRYISSFNHFELLEDSSKNLIDLFLKKKISIFNIYDSDIWLRKNYKDYNYIIIFENLENDLNEINKILKINFKIKIPNINPGIKNVNKKNYFKFNFNKKYHKDIYEFLKKKLQPDILIYNEICKIKGLDYLKIK